VLDVAFHPVAKAAYLVGTNIATLDLEAGGLFSTIVSNIALDGLLELDAMSQPWSHSAFPTHDGNGLKVFVVDPIAPFNRNVLTLDTTYPNNPSPPTPVGCDYIFGTPKFLTLRQLLRMGPLGLIGA
jgi:hypothetical protein